MTAPPIGSLWTHRYAFREVPCAVEFITSQDEVVMVPTKALTGAMTVVSSLAAFPDLWDEVEP